MPLTEPCPTEEEAAISQPIAKLRFVQTRLFYLSDSQALVGPGHEVRVAMGENGILIPVEEVEKGPKPNGPPTPEGYSSLKKISRVSF